jgi:hypothetical protein
MTRIKLIALIVGLLVCGLLGLVAAVAWSPESGTTEGAVERIRHGVTETGRVEAVTMEGQVHRVIRWRIRQGGIETQTVEGPLRLRSRGSMHFATRELRLLRLPGRILTPPTRTVMQTVTQTVQDTSIEIETVTETVEETVTETVTYPPP